VNERFEFARSKLNRVVVEAIVTRLGMGPRVRSSKRNRTAEAACLASVAVCLTLATSITATVVGTSRPAGADEISDLQAEAAQVSQQLLYEQLQVSSYEEQYAMAEAKLEEDVEQIDQTEQQIVQDDQRIEWDRILLREQAILDYTTSGSTPGSVQQLFGGNEKTAAAQTVYERVASDNVLTRVDALRGAENLLHVAENSLQAQRAQDQVLTDQKATLTQDAENTQAQLESLQSQISTQLAAAIAEQQAEEAAEAAAARAASSGGNGASYAGDGNLPAFLVCARQAESSGNYDAISPSGTYMGAFQFSQSTWDEAADMAGMPQLVGVAPNDASPSDQNALAIALYNADGEQPWYDPCRAGF
jgi:peptidoglycan hydrolase CwlO-like protein